MRYTLALQFSYWSRSEDFVAQDCGDRLKRTVLAAVDSLSQSELNNNVASELLSSTQVSIPRLRHRSLAQEAGCYAAEDVSVVSFLAPQGLLRRDDHLQSVDDGTRSFLNRILTLVNDRLGNETDHSVIALRGCKLLACDAKFHAERSCTQRIYHYLLPLTWLQDGLAMEQWWLEQGGLGDVGPHRNRAAKRPPSDALRAMKDALRNSESPVLEQCTKEESERLSVKIAAGRFGKLSSKKRMPWHNFADPDLRGHASPNNEPVWRVVDRARIIDMVRHEGDAANGRAIAVLEFRGDEFLPQQVRRIVGTALAVAHGWLPKDIFARALDSDVFLETPLAPAGRLYLAGCRFHFDELRSGGSNIFSSDVGGVSVADGASGSLSQMMQKEILDSVHCEQKRDVETRWLADLENVVAPRMRRQLGNIELSQGPLPQLNTRSPAFQELQSYKRTLSMLRDILHTGRWPETSAARSSVIRGIDKVKTFAEKRKGSFTIVNPLFENGLYRNGIGNDCLPLANEIFPELTEAVFALEVDLAVKGVRVAEGDYATHLRPASSHCAVNCNAQFTPHVDSGRGAGQSLSMIVGLGDYTGGELGVEGVQYDIRYQPLEFDGWRLRHWTLPFLGERFSLVWFTPERQANKEV
jgi:tRNA U38,U39,U40 pseudouridine synthase TruA